MKTKAKKRLSTPTHFKISESFFKPLKPKPKSKKTKLVKSVLPHPKRILEPKTQKKPKPKPKPKEHKKMPTKKASTKATSETSDTSGEAPEAADQSGQDEPVQREEAPAGTTPGYSGSIHEGMPPPETPPEATDEAVIDHTGHQEPSLTFQGDGVTRIPTGEPPPVYHPEEPKKKP
jgi:hypothetical protein